MGGEFDFSKSQIPTKSPSMPGRGEVVDNLDRCITYWFQASMKNLHHSIEHQQDTQRLLYYFFTRHLITVSWWKWCWKWRACSGLLALQCAHINGVKVPGDREATTWWMGKVHRGVHHDSESRRRSQESQESAIITGIYVSSTVRLYADDVLLYTSIKSEEDCLRLQQDLHMLEKWAATWKMSFNVNKCEFLRITNRISFVSNQYLLHNQIIHEVNHTKYLGVVIDSKLSWSQHIKEISNKASNVKSFLQRNLHNCPPSIKANYCYTSLIKPILE